MYIWCQVVRWFLMFGEYTYPLHLESGQDQHRREWWFWGYLESGIEIVVRIKTLSTVCTSFLPEMFWKITQLPDPGGVGIPLP
jgi:hypothetical protein